MKRRNLLITGTAGLVAVSGCIGNDGDESSPDVDETDETPEVTEENETVEEEVDPEFTVTSLSVEPATVGVGEEVTITVTVENVGETQGNYENTVSVNGSTLGTINIELNPGESSEAVFNYTPDESGIFDVQIEDSIEEFEAEIAEVGGVIQEDTTWSSSNSPYEVIDTVQVSQDVTLEIEPGVSIQSSPDLGRDSVFQLHGEIIAEGTEDNPITIDGKNNSGTFFDAEGSDENGYLSAEHCHVMDGGGFWWQGNAAFDLRHSTLENVSDSYIWYPFGREGGTINIEYNKFINSGGFSTGMRGDATINIRYNLFQNGKEAVYGGIINNWASYDNSEIIVEYNSFKGMSDMPVLMLPPNYDNAELDGRQNWWDTTNEDEISNMIYDENDDINSAGTIPYTPYLDEPHKDTPS